MHTHTHVCVYIYIYIYAHVYTHMMLHVSCMLYSCMIFLVKSPEYMHGESCSIYKTGKKSTTAPGCRTA